MRLEEEKSGEMTNSEDLPSKPAESQAEAVGFSFLYLSTTPCLPIGTDEPHILWPYDRELRDAAQLGPS